jgi:hypothetical protein
MYVLLPRWPIWAMEHAPFVRGPRLLEDQQRQPRLTLW